jgi:signal transduction histidine kinase
MTMQPLFQFKARLEAQSAAPLTGVPLRDVLQAQARQAASERKLARIAHELRNRLGAITAAVEVLNISEPGGELATEAQEVIGRQTRLLARMLHELDVMPREQFWNGAGVEQIVVDTAASWLQSHPLLLSLRGAGEESRLVLESK